MKKLLLMLGIMSSCYARVNTRIDIPEAKDAAVQCNNWGWVTDQILISWDNPCTPLEVKTRDDHIFKIATTDGVCKDDYQARYHYADGDFQITFDGCFPW